MYTFFNAPPVAQRGVTQPSSYAYVRRMLQGNVVKVLRYCRESTHAVRSDHLLVRILHDLNTSPELPLFEYYDKVLAKALTVAKANKLTSALWKGSVRTDGVFYGEGTYEVIFATTDDIDVMSVEKTWKSLSPVRILRNAQTSLSIEPLTGLRPATEKGVAVIQVDVVKLALQYRQWYQAQIAAGAEFFQTPMQFVYQYPLANALISHLEVAMMNRLKVLYTGSEGAPFVSSWPFVVRDYSTETDRYLLNRIAVMVSRSFVFDNLLQQVELVFTSTLQELITLPRTPFTRQIVWVLVVARMPVMSLLLQIDNETGGNRNVRERTVLRRIIRELRQDRDLTAGLPSDIGAMFELELEEEVEKHI